jgi:hypothetical protein
VIRFQDLMAARWLYQKFPQRRDVLLAGLDSLRDTPPGHRTLLGDLVAREVVTHDQASYVHNEVERFIRGRGVAIYGHLLARDGIPADRIKSLIDRLSADSDMDALGQLALNLSLTTPQRDTQLRFQARLALDRDMAMQVEQHLAQHPGRNVGLSGSGAGAEDVGEGRSVLSSSVIKGLDAQRLGLNLPADDEVKKIVNASLSDADAELPGPMFRIPDWIDMSHPRTGKQLQGYRILGLIGAGAMGEVYLVDHQDEPEKPVALKLLGRDAEEEAKGRFKREILANSFFSHPGALDVYDAGQTDRGHHYLAMEFFDGRDLEKHLAETRRISAAASVKIAIQVFETLAAAHEAGVIHRDVKPSNILVSWDGEQARLMDFGIATISDLDEAFGDRVFTSVEGGITGTPEYMSPEQAGGDVITASSDLYSMGVVLYQMLSGRLPFESETSGGFITCHLIEDPLPLVDADPACASLPPMLIELVDALLRKTAGARPGDAKTVLGDLKAVLPKLGQRPSGRLFSFLGWRRNDG